MQITERFAREYEEATGQPVRFRLSFGSSGTQARAVCDGLPADIGKVTLFPVSLKPPSLLLLMSTAWSNIAAGFLVCSA